MDPIKNMISATDPVHNDPSVPDGEAALRRILAGPAVFSDSLPANVVRFEDRKRRRARLAGVLSLAAAAVTAGVLVATNLGAVTTAPEPASTIAGGLGTASSTATATPTPSPAPTSTPTATRPASPTSTPKAAVGNGECTKENLTVVESWLAEQVPSMQVSGCAGGWMALTVPAASQAKPSPWFYVAKLIDGKFVCDTTQPWGQVQGWLSAGLNDDRLTAEASMDKEFATKGIPVELRKQLVGEPPAGSLAAQGIKTGGGVFSATYNLRFRYPAAWKVEVTPGGPPEYATYYSLTDASGRDAATLSVGEQNDASTSGCLNNAPYKVLDSQPMPGLPFDASKSSQGTPRFVYVALTSEANDGGPVQAAIGITNHIAGDEGIACVMDLSILGPGDFHFYSFGSQRSFGGPAWGKFHFNTLEEAAAFTGTAQYQGIKTVVTSLTIEKDN